MFSAYEVMAFPAIQEFALSFGVMVGKRDCDGSCSCLGLSGVSFWLFFSVYWVMTYRGLRVRTAFSVAWEY
ncbi:hypothetical protein [Escherichia coli]|uniref:hypothetical protein n=2 Tax=Escherichia coli TaxID=562 RepID=UPI0003A77F8B|nr:hypothetical protein [Escherichia coli]EFH8872784.1 hypothetical protein [Escherichia coli]EFU7132428.1 hypothetical protein [Escherichia coli]EII9938890.1 hypothetical protein [Escherichia coli]ELA5610282.1 hypothetical protein [Escherichia coli]MBA8282540.1 hypothetical protein [Escherichia coli]